VGATMCSALSFRTSTSTRQRPTICCGMRALNFAKGILSALFDEGRDVGDGEETMPPGESRFAAVELADGAGIEPAERVSVLRDSSPLPCHSANRPSLPGPGRPQDFRWRVGRELNPQGPFRHTRLSRPAPSPRRIAYPESDADDGSEPPARLLSTLS
jgi:hypothetical protein